MIPRTHFNHFIFRPLLSSHIRLSVGIKPLRTLLSYISHALLIFSELQNGDATEQWLRLSLLLKSKTCLPCVSFSPSTLPNRTDSISWPEGSSSLNLSSHYAYRSKQHPITRMSWRLGVISNMDRIWLFFRSLAGIYNQKWNAGRLVCRFFRFSKKLPVDSMKREWLRRLMLTRLCDALQTSDKEYGWRLASV